MKHLMIYLTIFLMSGILLSSCSSLKVTTDYDKTVDFTKYKTFEYYGWAKESDKVLNDLDKKRIEKAFSNELYKRGLSYVSEGGDLVVTLFIVVQEKTETTAHTDYYGGFGGYYGYGPGWGWGPGYSHTTYSTYNYKEGTLVIDIYDKKEKKLVYEAIGSKPIDESTSGRDERIAEVAAQMMKDYPVPPVEEDN